MITPETLLKVKNDVLATIDIFKQNKDWSIESINGKVDILQATILEVEKTSKEVGGLSSAEKKQLAVDIINSLVNIPILPEWIEAKVIEYVIDIVIALMNKWFGHLWVNKVPA